MDAFDLPSDSESSDEDFVPKVEGSDVLPSEEDSDDAIQEDALPSEPSSDGKRRKASPKKQRRKRLRNSGPVEEEREEKVVEEVTEEKKKRADALWADFLSDCGPIGKKVQTARKEEPAVRKDETIVRKDETAVRKVETPVKKDETPVRKDETPVRRDEAAARGVETAREKGESNGVSSSGKENTEEQPAQEPTFKIYDFAGEKVKVEGGARPGGRGAGRGGLAAVLSQISSKKGKLSTLEKSKLDWESFKNNEGITEQLATHNKGKNGYLEKQDFLQRADLRQFEVEKSLRASQRNRLN